MAVCQENLIYEKMLWAGFGPLAVVYPDSWIKWTYKHFEPLTLGCGEECWRWQGLYLGPCSLLSTVIICGNETGKRGKLQKGTTSECITLMGKWGSILDRGGSWGVYLQIFVSYCLRVLPQHVWPPLLRAIMIPRPENTFRQRESQEARKPAACPGMYQWCLCRGRTEGRPRNTDGADTARYKRYLNLCSLTSGEGRFPNRLTYVFKEGSCLQHDLFEVKAHVSVCEQLQDLFQSLQALTDNLSAGQVVQASDDRF